jgi:hypothetical protein
VEDWEPSATARPELPWSLSERRFWTMDLLHST